MKKDFKFIFAGVTVILLLFATITFSQTYNNNQEIKETVRIGDQVWSAQNADFEFFNKQKMMLPEVKTKKDWEAACVSKIPAYFKAVYGEDYEYYYNWWAIVNENSLAPEGWHVATIEDWNTMLDYVRKKYFKPNGKTGETLKGTKTLKGTLINWKKYKDANNLTGFNALPLGYVNGNATVSEVHECAAFWTTSRPDGAGTKPAVYLIRDDIQAANAPNVICGYPVRFVKDNVNETDAEYSENPNNNITGFRLVLSIPCEWKVKEYDLINNNCTETKEVISRGFDADVYWKQHGGSILQNADGTRYLLTSKIKWGIYMGTITVKADIDGSGDSRVLKKCIIEFLTDSEVSAVYGEHYLKFEVTNIPFVKQISNRANQSGFYSQEFLRETETKINIIDEEKHDYGYGSEKITEKIIVKETRMQDVFSTAGCSFFLELYTH